MISNVVIKRLEYTEKHKALISTEDYVMTSLVPKKFRTGDKKFNDFDKFFHEMQSIHKAIHSAVTAEINNAIIRMESIPSSSTIRLEFVKCGKSNCNNCSENYNYRFHGHGPFYYAYYRDKENHGRLKKKYIGGIDPRDSYVKEFLSTLKNSDCN